jgi:two-component system response regulator HydG
MSKQLKILVVDDNDEFAQSLADILRLKGHEVTTANDGFQALEFVKQSGYDLVLMDVKMPVMDGVETFKKIKQVAPGTVVFMITAYAVEDLIREALQEGAFGSLRKPLDFDELFHHIEQATADNGMLILVVDDDKNLCGSLNDILGSKGYRVSVAYDGTTALEKARENNFDVLLIDLKMPALNGLETYRAIREFRPNVTAVIMTGYTQESEALIKQAVKENVYICLDKPIDQDKLESILLEIKKLKEEGTST